MSKVYVGNLSWNTTEEGLAAEFGNFGTVTEAKIIMDRDTNRSKGFAFVTFATDAEAKSAIESLDGQMIDGRAVRVSVAENKPRPRTSGGYSQDRGNSRGGYSGGGSGGDRY